MLKAAFGVLVTALVVWPCLAQPQYATTEPPKPAAARHFYRLDFVVKELEGTRVTNSRAYSMTLSSDHASRSSIRTGAKIPTHNSYVDVGVNIDSYDAVELGNQLSMNVSAEISSIADNTDSSPNGGLVIRNSKWISQVILPLRHPTVLFSSDDPTSTRKMQLELTATPVQ